jgi:glycosyltransferase involved in cell wall biosynthesis
MFVAMLSWLKSSPVPPKGYGGIQRVVATLTRELLRQGHQVALIAPPGSFIEGAQVIEVHDFDEAYQAVLELKPDVLHSHECWSLESVVRRPLQTPFICTTHVNHAIGWSSNVVYLSFDQRDYHAAQLGHSLPLSPVVRVPTSPDLKPQGLPKLEYLLFLGSVTAYKGTLRAARLACILGRELVVAGPAAGEYADEVAQHENVTMVGEVQDPYRSELLEQAYAVTCLHGNENNWREPGCGVVGEAGAMNTPVAALPNGCLKEIVIHEDNGWIADTTEALASAIMTTPDLPHPGWLAQVEWSAENITRQYVALYEKVCNGETWD